MGVCLCRPLPLCTPNGHVWSLGPQPLAAMLITTGSLPSSVTRGCALRGRDKRWAGRLPLFRGFGVVFILTDMVQGPRPGCWHLETTCAPLLWASGLCLLPLGVHRGLGPCARVGSAAWWGEPGSAPFPASHPPACSLRRLGLPPAGSTEERQDPAFPLEGQASNSCSETWAGCVPRD